MATSFQRRVLLCPRLPGCTMRCCRERCKVLKPQPWQARLMMQDEGRSAMTACLHFGVAPVLVASSHPLQPGLLPLPSRWAHQGPAHAQERVRVMDTSWVLHNHESLHPEVCRNPRQYRESSESRQKTALGLKLPTFPCNTHFYAMLPDGDGAADLIQMCVNLDGQPLWAPYHHLPLSLRPSNGMAPRPACVQCGCQS